MNIYRYIPGESKKFRRLGGCGIKSILAIFKTSILTYQSKVNIDVKILFGKVTHHLDPEIWKMLEGACFGIKNSTFDSGP